MEKMNEKEPERGGYRKLCSKTHSLYFFFMSRPPSLIFSLFINEVEGVKALRKAWLAQPQLPALTARFLPITSHPGRSVLHEVGFGVLVVFVWLFQWWGGTSTSSIPQGTQDMQGGRNGPG